MVRLAPGERFQLDIWCLPTPHTLAYLFDLVESAALLVLGADPAVQQACLSGAAFCDRLADELGIDPAAIRTVWTQTAKGRPGPAGPCAAGQLLLPGPNEIALVARNPARYRDGHGVSGARGPHHALGDARD